MVGTTTVVLTVHTTPAWTVLVSIVFFPIGLLSLLARKTRTVTFALQPLEDQHLLVQYQGHCTKRTWRQLVPALTTPTLIEQQALPNP